MKVVSDALYEAIHRRNRKFKLRLDFGEFQITNAENYKTELISSPSSGLAVGCVAIGSGSFEIKNNVVDVANKVFRAYIGMEIQGQMEWIKLGKYTVKNVEKKGTKDVVSFEDDISLLDARFDETLTLPTSSTAVLERIETICGVNFDFNSFDVPTAIDKQLEGFSCRDIVGWIAQLMGLFVVVDNQTEQISAKWYVDSDYVINDTNYLYMIDEPTTDAHFRLEAISCQTGLETLVASNENAVGVMSISNPLMTQSRLDVIFSERKNFEYDEGELSFLLGNPLFDPWDIITVEYRGKTSVFPVMSLSFAFNGGFTTKIKSFVRDEDTAFEGNITKQIADVKTRVTVLDGYVATEVVKNEEVVTAINASDEDVTIMANKINLVGLIESIFAQEINVSGKFTATAQVYIPPDEEILERIKRHIFREELIPDAEIPLYDFNGNGVINSNDFTICKSIIYGTGTLQENHVNAQPSTVTITITPSDITEAIKVTGTDMWGRSNEVVIGSNGVSSRHIDSEIVKATRVIANDIKTHEEDELSGSVSTGEITATDADIHRANITDIDNLRRVRMTPDDADLDDVWEDPVLQLDYVDDTSVDVANVVKGLTGNIQEQIDAVYARLKGTTLYEVDPTVTDGIYCNGNVVADGVNSATLADSTKKYKRLKIFARFPQGTHIQEFELETTAQGSSANFGNRVGGILIPTGDNVSGASRHYLYKLNFCVMETLNGWTFQVTDSGWVNMGIPSANTTQYASASVTINGTAYQAFNQRHNSDYCIYKIVGYEN